MLTTHGEPPAGGPAAQAAGPDLLYFGLFDNCNVRCNMCDCWELPRARLPLDHYRTVLASVLELAPAVVRFTGGEPLLLRGLPHLIRRAADVGARVSVITNGRLLAGRARQLAEAGCTEIVLSLDATAETHDLIRGTAGLFARCLDGRAAVVNARMAYGVNTVVQGAGVEELAALADSVLDSASPPRWWHLIPVRGNPLLLPTTEQRARLREDIARLGDRARAAGVQLVADPDMFAPAGGPAACGVPGFTAYLRADTGDLYGCNMLVYDTEPIGNLLTESAASVWANASAMSLRDRCATASNPACGRCDAGSRAMNYHLRTLAER